MRYSAQHRTTMATALVLLSLGAGPISEAAPMKWDFSDGMGAWRIQEGTWAVDEGALIHEDPHFKGGLAGLPGMVLSDFRFEADVQITELYWDKESVWAGLLVRATKPVAHGGWHDGYRLIFRANGEAVLAQAAGEGKELGKAMTGLRPAESTVRLAIEAKGPRFRVFAGDALLFEGEDDAFTAGEVALTNFGNTARFDNVRLEGEVIPAQAPEVLHPIQPEPAQHAPVTPLPRLAVRKEPGEAGTFYARESGKPFFPKGFNHTVLEHGDGGWHATFNEGIYDPEKMEEVLRAMAAAGGNTIRVWVWGVQKASGFTGGGDAMGLNGAYMENVVDFLRRATRHKLYVIPILDEVPHNAYYNNVADRADFGKADPMVSGHNRQVLSPGPIAAKAEAIRHFVQYVKDADPGLLNAVLGWSFFNEAFVNHTEGPFMYDAGTVTPANGTSYDMADKAQRQACFDDSMLYWANKLSDAVKSVDPEALTNVGMWTSDAHGRPPYNGLLPDDRDPRRPPRPSVLAGEGSKLDFIDVHIYPWDGTSKVRAEAHESAAVLAGSIPAIVGEYGVFKNKTAEEAKAMMREMLQQAYAMGYIGQLHWVWDLTAVEGQTWSSVEAGIAEYVMGITK